MSVLAPRKVSAQQWGAYWGMTKIERLQKVLESLLVAYGGAWMAWFLSMLAGNVVSSFAGTALIFNWMYSPWLNAKKRNSKIWQSGNQKLCYALYAGRITRFV
jgi:ABC-type spermidine/putrescine transport system permease subunit II